MTVATGPLVWSQAGNYNAVDDRAVVSAAFPVVGVIRAATLAAGAGLTVNVGPFQAVLDCGDGTRAVAASTSTTSLTVAAGPAASSRTDVIWLSPGTDPEDGSYDLRVYQSGTQPASGLSLGTVLMPQGAGTAAAATLTPAPQSLLPPGMVFPSAAARDAAWVTPPNGAQAFLTDSGALFVRRAGVWKPLPLGYLATATGPASAVNFTGLADAVTLSVPVITGRRYLVHGYCNGQQITASGAPRFQISDDQGGGPQYLCYFTTQAASNACVGSTSYLFVPNSTRTAVLHLQAATSTGALQVAANGCRLTIEDIGA